MRKFLIGIILAIVLTFGGTIANAADPYPYRTPKADANGQEVIVLMGMIAQDGHEILGVVDDKLGNYMLWVIVNGNCGAFFLQVDPKMVIPMTCAQGLMLFEQSVSRGDTIDPRDKEISFNGYGIGGYGAFGDMKAPIFGPFSIFALTGPLCPLTAVEPD